jgi:hypothetical protein
VKKRGGHGGVELSGVRKTFFYVLKDTQSRLKKYQKCPVRPTITVIILYVFFGTVPKIVSNLFRFRAATVGD